MRVQLYRGAYYAVWREGGETKRSSLRTRDRATAERRLADQLAKPTGNTIAAIVAAYLAKKADSRSAATMRYSWQALDPHFGQYRPDQITPAMCKAYAKARKVKPGTIIRDLGFLRTAVGAKGGEFWLPPQPPPKDRHLTRSEFQALLDATPLPHLRLFMNLALATGARTGALLGLTWDRVDLARGVLRLKDGQAGGKGRSEATPLNKRAREALEAAYEGRTSDWVIEWAGKRVGSVKKGFREACARAGLEGVTPHVLRHTAAVWLIEGGCSLVEVAQYLGHSDTRTTFRVYARHSPDHQRKAAALLD
jgi:integrase